MGKNSNTLIRLQNFFLFLAAALYFCGASFPAGAAEPGPEPANIPEIYAEPSRPLRKLNREAGPPSGFTQSGNFRGSFSRHSPTLLEPSAMGKNLTLHYINQYSSRGGLEWLGTIWKRGAPYVEFIRGKIEERGLPPELIFLPIIESQFSPGALSRSGASGLWQFMKNSVAPFDMKVNEWVDERRDFWKSTEAALQKLEENYNYFGDWPLALAAYNAGLGAIRRVIKDSGLSDYWELSEKKLLKTETLHYVPKLLAASYILSNPGRFGLSPVWDENPKWTRIAVNRQADLNILAKEAGVDAEFLKQANRELLHNITPPGEGYYLKARSGDADKIAAALLKQELALVRYYTHTIRSGDTLLALALHYGISVEQILSANPGIEARFLKIGAGLMIPALKEAAPFENRPGEENLNFNGTYLVKKGETLWSIALAHDLDPEILAEANGMGLNDILREGRTLKTPIR